MGPALSGSFLTVAWPLAALLEAHLLILISCYKCDFIVRSLLWRLLHPSLGTAISHLCMKWVALLQFPGRRSIKPVSFSHTVSVQTAAFLEEHALDVLIASLNHCPKAELLTSPAARLRAVLQAQFPVATRVYYLAHTGHHLPQRV